MKINVTEEDIKLAESETTKGAFNCPIAQALKRTFASSNFTNIGACHRYFLIGPFKFAVPESVLKFIYAFDLGDPVEPFEFELLELIYE